MTELTRLVLVAVLAVAGPSGSGEAAARPDEAEQAAAGRIEAAALRAHVKFLSSDLLEGRLPGTRGDRLARAYIAARFEALGLEPAAPGGGYFQTVPLVGVESRLLGPLRLAGRQGALELSGPDELMMVAGGPRPRSAWARAGVVFVGHGISAPEHGWDDFKGTDLRGKVLLVMNGNPPLDPVVPEARLYVGRWTYKFEEAARRGAVGAIIIHTTASAAYPWQVVRSSWSGAQFDVPDETAPRLEIEGWATEEACRRLVALGGQDLDRLRAAAARPDFRPVPLGVEASLEVAATLSRAETANVLARLPGGDPARAGEAVLYTAHHDHLGVRPGAAPGDDAIFNGAVDNATGVAGILEVAAAFAALPRRPARSVLFAATAAEEQGTIGSGWLAHHLPLPAGRLAAVINLDAMNVFGRTRDLVALGRGRTSLDGLLDGLAASQGRVVRSDPDPAAGGYYRSDHFPLAQVGVPGLFLVGGQDFVGRPEGWGRATRAAWAKANYHQPSDEWRDEYDLSGMVEDARLAFFLGAKVAGAAGLPGWRARRRVRAGAARRRGRGGAGALTRRRAPRMCGPAAPGSTLYRSGHPVRRRRAARPPTPSQERHRVRLQEDRDRRDLEGQLRRGRQGGGGRGQQVAARHELVRGGRGAGQHQGRQGERVPGHRAGGVQDRVVEGRDWRQDKGIGCTCRCRESWRNDARFPGIDG